jgi:glycosyltransferase involved in cell wall biosynthesis
MPVGVVVPVHGWAPFLAEALDAVLDEGPDQVVVIDDGSPEPLALHPDHAPRCELVRREARGGPAPARQAGLAALRPDVDLVALCDADDAWRPGKLAAQRAALDAHPGAALCFGRAEVVGPDGRATGERWAEPAAGPHPGTVFYAHNPLPTSSVVVRRSPLEATGGFASDLALAEDWDVWLRLAAAGATFLCVPETRVAYRRQPGSLTTDVAALAAAQRALHRAHGGLVDRRTRRRALAADTRALARERLRRAVR